MKKLLLVNRNAIYEKATPARIITSFFTSFTLSFVLRVLLVAAALFFSLYMYAQPGDVNKQEADYKKAVTDRSAKIVSILGITDSGTYDKVLNELVSQYIQLNAVHEKSKTVIAGIKAQILSPEEKSASIKKQEEKKSAELLQQHNEFIAHLKEVLAEEQLEKVKDGMTYRVFPVTYAAYQDMLPNLTKEQKEKIYNWLKEARELAMDEGSSEDKHKVFGKYKGKINNYLSSLGYDLKKETEAWQRRIKERQIK